MTQKPVAEMVSHPIDITCPQTVIKHPLTEDGVSLHIHNMFNYFNAYCSTSDKHFIRQDISLQIRRTVADHQGGTVFLLLKPLAGPSSTIRIFKA